MSDTEKAKRRLYVRRVPRDPEGPRNKTVQLTARTAGLLAYYAAKRRLSESNVVEQALAQLFGGLRISEPTEATGQPISAA